MSRIYLTTRRLAVLLGCVAMCTALAPGGSALAARADRGGSQPAVMNSEGSTPTLLAAFGPTVIRNATTGKCVDLPGYGPGSVDGPVYQYTCDSSSADNQLFYFDDAGVGDGHYNIWNAKDGLCLDVPNYGSVPAGTAVSEYYCDATYNDNQLFYFNMRSDGHYWIVNDASGLCLDVAGFGTGGNDARINLYTCSDSDDHHWIV